jgi:streptogramin lyase
VTVSWGARAAVATIATFVAFAGLGAKAAGEQAPDPSRLQGPRAIAAGSDGGVWVVDSVGIMRISLDGRFSRVLQADELRGIARGPDGAIWFAQDTPARIGRIASDGSVDYFSAGISQSPSAITAGPDGNLWFTEPGGLIGRITPAGAITEFAKAHAEPVEITAGRDGNVWFSDFWGRIGRVTPAGKIREFTVPHNAGGLKAIASGRDGSLWYGIEGQVGRMTTAGRTRLFNVPFFFVDGIALGSDGNMWVVGYVARPHFGAAVARITPRGKLRLFRKGLSGYDTQAIVSGPGHALSVTEDGRRVDGIARVSTKGAVRELPPTGPCVVPSVARLPLPGAEDVAFGALCRLDARSHRAGKRRGTVALRVSPKPGTTLPFDSALRVTFGPVPPLPRHCRLPFGGRRMASSPTVLVYSYTDYDPEYADESKTRYGACLRPHGRLHAITTGEDIFGYYAEAARFVTAGDFVAYNFYGADRYGNANLELRVYDVRRARHVFDRTVEHYDSGALPAPDDPLLGEYVVSEHGAVAWLSQEGLTVRLLGRPLGGAVRELDSGPSLSGLSFSGDTLSWTSGSGERRSAEVR